MHRSVVPLVLALAPGARAQDEPEPEPPPAEIVVVAPRDPVSPGERSVETADLRRFPGSFDDPVRALQNLPGVARSPFGLGALIVRGLPPESAAFSVDGLDVPLVFHFSGLTTVVPAELLAGVTLVSGDAGVRYGRNLGARVELHTRGDVPERTGGAFSLDVFQASALVDVRVGERTAVSVALRRSWLDAVLDPVLSRGADTVRAPSWWDAQVRLVHRLPGLGSVEGLVLVSEDRFTVVGDDDTGSAAALGYTSGFEKALFRWRTVLPGGWRSDLGVGIGPERRRVELFGESAREEVVGVQVREELLHDEGGPVAWRLGLDLRGGHTEHSYGLSSFGGPVDAVGGPERGRAPFLSPALYLESTLRRGPAELVLGARGELWTYAGTWTAGTVDPRGALRVRVGPETLLRADAGLQTAWPALREVRVGEGAAGNPALHPPRALHTSVGVEQRWRSGLALDGTFFATWLWELTVGREDRFRFFQVPPGAGPLDGGPYASEGSGRAYGAELLLRYDSPAWLAWLAATFSRSVRTDRNGETTPWDYDQPVVLTALASARLPQGWSVGGRVRLSSGTPYAEVENRVLDLDTHTFVPLFGEHGSARLPPVWTIDVRIDKTWVLRRRGTLTLYLDVQNVANRRPVEIVGWTPDYAALDGVIGLPVLPVLGLRGAF